MYVYTNRAPWFHLARGLIKIWWTISTAPLGLRSTTLGLCSHFSNLFYLKIPSKFSTLSIDFTKIFVIQTFYTNTTKKNQSNQSSSSQVMLRHTCSKFNKTLSSLKYKTMLNSTINYVMFNLNKLF